MDVPREEDGTRQDPRPYSDPLLWFTGMSLQKPGFQFQHRGFPEAPIRTNLVSTRKLVHGSYVKTLGEYFMGPVPPPQSKALMDTITH